MHPQVRLGEPGSCPICGMDLIPVADSAASDESPTDVTLGERARTLARIRTAAVTRGSGLNGDLQLLGRVETDERRLHAVTTWVAGRIDRLHVQVTGERVRRGQAIATLYSPEVYAAHQDLLAAQRVLTRLANATPPARTAAEAGLEATRERLRLLGITDATLVALEGTARPQRQVVIRSPFAGTVITRDATEGMTVGAGAPLYHVADLSRVWVQLDAYERDLPALAVGQEVSLQVAALPQARIVGSIAFIDPVVDARRRVARVRVEVENPDGQLRPGMFAEARVSAAQTTETGEPDALLVPATAPLFTGRRSVVYVELDDVNGVRTYRARVVRLGARRGDVYPVLAGLREGERVVVEGAFALDADLQIRGGDSMMAQSDDRTPGLYDELVPTPTAFRVQLARVVEAYLALQEALAADDLDAASAAAGLLSRSLDGPAAELPASTIAAWREVEAPWREAANEAETASSLADARRAFHAISQALERSLDVFGNVGATPLDLVRCPMARSGAGATWVQRSAAIANPYFGPSMATCGESLRTLEPTP
ncbi:MAG: efflux RND transporter periplasmic adaptor subunit [Myxococcales bacterium]|nr:efflux RND transporter periplasmic adaptor subunit [Myxococcales bacterium]